MARRTLPNKLWYSLLWIVCWVVSKTWFRFLYTGRAHVPAAGPVLLVANHQSHLDPVLVGVACSRPVGALARHSLFFWPLGWLIRTIGAVPIDRGRAGVAGFKAALTILRDGEVLLVFPEGTRTSDGSLQQFHPGFCALARRSSATIVPVSVDGAFKALPRGSFIARPLPIRLNFSEPITIRQYAELTDEQLISSIRRQIRDGMNPFDSER
jgi:1-acyl-sn-glycerol-3-phosphate acyltransferase